MFLMNAEFQLPVTTQHPDNVYFDSKVVSWDFVASGKKATLGFIQPGFEEIFPVSDGGEQITLEKPEKDAYLAIAELNDAGEVEQSHVLTEDGEQVYVPGGRSMRVTTASKIVEYVCVYPGQPVDS